ncbi:MAG: hypothetical protein KC535_03225 [Nanoarchaeota archaeon]|nr:hypothetical protein [Nanoarchaeota archaeon]
MNRAQVAMEYMIIFSMTFFMSLLLIILFTTQTNNIRTDLANAQMDKAGSEIVDAASQVYFMGDPAQKTIRVTFPEGVKQVSINNTFLVFSVQTSEVTYDIVKETSINMTGSIKTFEGIHNIVVKAQGGVVVISDN